MFFLRLCLPLILCCCAGAAHAQLTPELRALLAEADRSQDADGFRETAGLVARIAPNGMADVENALAEIAPDRLALIQPAAAPEVPETALAMAESPAAAPATEAQAEADAPVWRQATDWVRPAAWDGRVSLGVRMDRGNTEQSDYTFGLDLDRELEGGWDFDGKIEYAYSEVAGAVSRDNWLIEARGERSTEGRWGYFIGGGYEKDRLSGYDYSAFVSVGAAYQILETETRDWSVRVGPGVRYLALPAGSNETELALDLGSDFEWQISETTQFTAETSILAAASTRAEQRFAITTAIAANWGLEFGFRAKHEFEPQPGREATDTRMDISIVRDF